jgi:hypothetical protein
MTTDFINKTSILSELWTNYRDDDALEDFIDYNDIGLPLAYLVNNKIVLSTLEAESYINETFDLLLNALWVDDIGFENLDEILSFSSTRQY